MNAMLESRLQEITDVFVTNLIGIFRSVVEDTVGVGGGGPRISSGAGARRGRPPGGRRGRRSPAETEALAAKVARYVAGQAKGIRVEAMGKALGMSTAELMVPIKKALADKKIKKSGQRRATTYFPGKK